MGVFSGYLCLVCFFVLIAKALTRKLSFKKADQILMRLHKPACAALIVLCPLHMIWALPVLPTRHILILITGLLAAGVLLLLLILCHVQREDEAKQLRRHRRLSALLLFCIAGHMAIYSIDFRAYQESIRAIQLREIDLTAVADGQYLGAYDAGYITATVKVTVSNGKFDRILLLTHQNEKGRAAERVISDIVSSQTFPVDAIRGATNSSKVIQQAMQNALVKTNLAG